MKNKKSTYINVADALLMLFFGYCEINIKGSPKDALSTVIALGIRFTDVRNTSDGITFKIFAASRKRVCFELHRLCAEFSCSSIKGAPAPIIALSRRYGLVLGLLCALAISVASEYIVWEISVIGNEKIKTSEIVKDLEGLGIRHGALINALDTDAICTQYLLENERLSWIRINAVGNCLQVVVREKDARPENGKERPSNLVAACDGLIYRVETLGGQRLVSGGESVSGGQILVSGLVENELSGLEGVYIENPTYRFERSEGKVFAITKDEITVEIPMVISEKRYTGEIYQKKSLIFFSKVINFFFLGRNSHESCDIIETYEYIELPGGKVLPVSVKNTVFKKFTEESVPLSEAMAKRLAENELADKISALLGDDGVLLSKSVSTLCENGTYTLKCSVGSIRNIAIETPLFSSDS